MPAYLETILHAHRAVDSLRGDPSELIERAVSVSASSPTRGFAASLRASGLSLIAEVKRKSPSEGALNQDLDPVVLANDYVAGGADCISVLTDTEFFGGSVDDLQSVSSAVTLPILRKDFSVSVRDIADTRIMGADAVLLIVAALSQSELVEMHSLALQLGLSPLIEVHDAEELARVRDVDDVQIVGVNQRNLKTFEITDAAVVLRNRIPDGVVAVCESGIRGAEDAHKMADLGYDAVLVGSSLVRAGDPVGASRAIKQAGV